MHSMALLAESRKLRRAALELVKAALPDSRGPTSQAEFNMPSLDPWKSA